MVSSIILWSIGSRQPLPTDRTEMSIRFSQLSTTKTTVSGHSVSYETIGRVMLGLFALYLGLKFIFPGEGEPLYAAMRILLYALVGLWATLGAPWLFLRLRLASSE